MWSLKYMSCLFTIEAHDGWVKTLAIRDKSLYSGAFDYLVKVKAGEEGEKKRRLIIKAGMGYNNV
jgi:hypothetical protein